MIHSITGVSSEIVEIGFDYMLEIVKHGGHSSLEGCFRIIKAKRHFPICECTPRTNKFRLMLVLGINLNFVIP
jgi:hypothetical protein